MTKLRRWMVGGALAVIAAGAGGAAWQGRCPWGRRAGGPPDRRPQSALSATIGSMRDARRAGR